jgi:RimJ/RimL family protein N-acetyltransferase
MTRRPPYRIETERLELRCWSPADAPVLRRSLDDSDQHLRPHIPFMRHEPRSLAETVDWLRQIRAAFDRDEYYRYAAFDAEATLVGETMLLDRHGAGEWAVGYWLDVAQCGNGYATEATTAMLRVAFELLDIGHLELVCAVDNTASAAVATKLGFTHDATLRRRLHETDGVVRDSMVWTLFADEASSSAAAGFEMRAFDCIDQELIGR